MSRVCLLPVPLLLSSLAFFSLCQAVGRWRRGRNASEQWSSERAKKQREERRREPLSIFSIISIHPPPRSLPEKLFLVSKCQNFKRCGVGRFHMLDMFDRLRARNQMIDVSVEVNFHNWPIIRSWNTEMRFWRQCLQAPLLGLSPAPTLFLHNCSRWSFLIILEPGTG